MYSILRNKPLRAQLARDGRAALAAQAFSLIPALLVTHLFFHWKSFLLEFGGFLVTWFVIDLVLTAAVRLWVRPQAPHSSA